MNWLAILLILIPISQNISVKELKDCYSKDSSQVIANSFQSALEKCQNCKDLKEQFDKCIKYEDKQAQDPSCSVHDSIMDQGDDSNVYIEAFKTCRNFCVQNTIKNLTADEKKIIQPAFLTYKLEVNKCLGITKMTVEDLNQCQDNKASEVVNQAFQEAEGNCASCRSLRKNFNDCMTTSNSKDVNCNIHYAILAKGPQSELYIDSFKSCRRSCLGQTLGNLTDLEKSIIQPAFNILKNEVNKCLEITDVKVVDFKSCIDQKASQKTNVAFDKAFTLCDKPEQCKAVRDNFNKCMQNDDPDSKTDACKRHDDIIDQGDAAEIDIQAFKECRANCITKKVETLNDKQKLAIWPAFEVLEDEVNHCIGIENGITVQDVGRCLKDNNYSAKVKSTFRRLYKFCPTCTQQAKQFNLCIAHLDPDSEHPDCKITNALFQKGEFAKLDPQAFKSCLDHCSSVKIDKIDDEWERRAFQNALWVYKREISTCVGIDQITIKELKECYSNNAWSEISKTYTEVEKKCPKCKDAREKVFKCLYNDDPTTANKDCRVYATQFKLGDKSLFDAQSMKTCRHYCQEEALKDLDEKEKQFFLTGLYTNNVLLNKCIGVGTTVKDYQYCIDFVQLENLGAQYVKDYPDANKQLSKFGDCINYKDSSAQDINCKLVSDQIKQGGVTEMDLEAFKSCRSFCTDNILGSITKSDNKKTMNELLRTVKIHFNKCLGVEFTVQDLDQCYAKNASEKVNKQFSKAIEKCSECSNVRTDFENCLKNEDQDSKHADCNIHDNVIDSGKEAELDIDSFKVCRNHCEVAKTKNLKPEQKKAIQPAFNTYNQEVNKCLNMQISVRDLLTCYSKDGIQYVNDEFERSYKKCDNCKDLRAKMNKCLLNLEKTQSHPDCEVLFKGLNLSEEYPLDIEAYKNCRAHCIEVNTKDLSVKDKKAIQPTFDVWKTYSNQCMGIETTVSDLNQCFKDNASQVVEDAFKLAVKLCPLCANFRSDYEKCLRHEDSDSKHEDCQKHDAIMDQGNVATIDRDAFKNCRAHCINTKLSKYDSKQRRALMPAINTLKKQVDQCLGIAPTVADFNTCYSDNASQKVEDAFQIASSKYNQSNQIRQEFTKCLSNNDPDSKHPDCIDHDSIIDQGGNTEIDQDAYLKCKAYCYSEKVLKKLTDDIKLIVEPAFNTLFSETERCLEIDPTVADLQQCANEDSFDLITKIVRKADRSCPECNVITRYNGYVRCVNGSEKSKEAQHEDCIDHNYVIQMSKKYGTHLELDIPSFKKCRQHCYQVIAKVDDLNKTQIQIINPAFDIVNKYWNDCLDIAPQVYELNKCFTNSQTEIVNEAFKQAVSSCPECKDFKTSFEKCLQDDDPDAKHDDCMIHDSIVDQGSNTEININAFKTCRSHCQDAKVNKNLSEHQKWSIAPAFNTYKLALNECLSIDTTVQDYNNCLKDTSSQKVTWVFDRVERQCQVQECKNLRDKFNQCINNTGLSTKECSNHYAILKVGDNAELDINAFTDCRASCFDLLSKDLDSKTKSYVLPAFNVLKLETNQCIGINLIAKDLDQCMHLNGSDLADIAFDEAIKTCPDCRKLRREYDQCLIDENSSNADCKTHAKLYALKDSELNIQSFKKCVEFCQNDKLNSLTGDVKKAASTAFSVLKTETYKCMGVTSNVTEYNKCFVDTGSDQDIKKLFEDLGKNAKCKNCSDVKSNFDKCLINVDSSDQFCKRHANIIKSGGDAQIEIFSLGKCKQFCLKQEFDKLDATSQQLLKPAFTKYYGTVKDCLGITTQEIVTKEEAKEEEEENKQEEENEQKVTSSSSIVIVQVLMTLLAIVV